MVQKSRQSRALGIRVAGALFLMMGVTGCLSGGSGPSDGQLKNSPIFSKSKATPSKDLVSRVSVMKDAVVIAAPKGYCIDVTSTTDKPDRAFVPMGACSAMTKNPADPKPKMTAFITASVLPLPVSASECAS